MNKKCLNLLRLGFLFLIYVFVNHSCYAYDLVLPKEKKNFVDTNYALFVGKAKHNELIKINDQWIFTASNGAFSHSVKLKEGENRVIIKSGFKTQVYKFYKERRSKVEKLNIIDFEEKKFVILKDNIPLRSSPVDGGMNRISHLFKGTTILVNGEAGDFYRVFLSKDKQAWIAKKDVNEVDVSNLDNRVPVFYNMNSQKFKNATVQTISFSHNLPYTVEENSKEILFKIYNPEFSEHSVYTLTMPLPKKYTYKVSLKEGMYTFKVSELPSELEDMVIVIDPGHGGTEKGAVGCLGDKEKDINLKIAQELDSQLKAIGVKTFMTRVCDGNMSLEDRVSYAQKNDANIFISVHLNSIGDIPMNIYRTKGTSVYYYNPEAKKLSEILEKSISKNASTKRDGVRAASFAVIRPTDYIGILIECAYMINPFDSVLYTSEDFAYNVAKGIVSGITDFVLNQ